MRKVVQFGAGNIGRGFLGQLFSQSGYETVFVDIIPQLVSSLNKRGFYHLRVLGDNPQDLIIENVRAVEAKDKEAVAGEILSADLMATAVGARNLPAVATLVARGMEKRAEKGIEEPINLIICENILRGSETLNQYLIKEIHPGYLEYLKDHLGLVESVIDRMVPVIPERLREKDPTFIMAEEYGILPVDKKGFKGEIPRIKGMIPCDNIVAYEEQKLFTLNTGHAICAYLGYHKGYRYIWESIRDEKIRDVVEGALMETTQALVKKHHFKLEEQKNLAKDILHRFNNRALGDTVVRVGRDPVRKLAPQDRLVGAARLAQSYGITPLNICRGIAAAIFFNYPKDEEAVRLTRMRKKEGIDGVLKNVCQIDPGDELAELIKKHIKEGFALT